jgi:hypothetical protein
VAEIGPDGRNVAAIARRCSGELLAEVERDAEHFTVAHPGCADADVPGSHSENERMQVVGFRKTFTMPAQEGKHGNLPV